MDKIEYVKEQTKKKYDTYNFTIPFEKLKWSGEVIDAELNDETVELVDRLVEFTLCKISAAYFIDRYGWTFQAKGGPVPLKLFDFQRTALEEFQKHGKSIFRKCLTENNYILTKSGQYKSIKDVKKDEYVETIKNGKREWTKVIDSWKNEELKSVVQIHMWNGSMIESTLDHKIMTKEGWKEAQELSIKDEIILSDNQFGEYELESDELAKIIGYYIADGKASEPTFANTNKKYVDEIFESSKIFKDINPYIKHKKQEKHQDRYDVRFTGNRDNKKTSFQNFMSKYNLDIKSNDRYFSPEIINLNKKQLSILLNRMYAGDGWVGYSLGNKKQGDFYIGYGTPNKVHAYQIQHLLSKYGIWAKIITNKYKEYNTFYKVIIPNKVHVLKFAKEIGIYDKIDDNYISMLESKIKYKQKGEYNKIRKIIQISKPKKTYDITTESSDFIANGVQVHNSRQVGASVISGSYAIWRANFHMGEMIKIISLTRSDATEFKEKTIDLVYELMPGWMKTKTTRDGNSKTKLKLENKSQIQILPKSKNAGRGGTPSLIIIDEAAFNEWMPDIWKSIEPSLDKGGDCIVISTTNGVGNWYYTTYTKAEQSLNEFHPIFIPWWRYPNRSNPWREDVLEKLKSGEWSEEDADKFIKSEQKKQLSYKGPPEDAPWLWKRYSNAETDREFRQEILAEFLGSGDTFVDYESLLRLEEIKVKPKYKNKLPTGKLIKGLWVWNEVDYDSMYMLVADTATGHGKDFSALHVIDIFTKEQVAEVKAQVATDTFGQMIKDIARYYNNAYVVIECNHPGPATFNEVFKHKTDPYHNVYVKNKSGEPWGWDTTPRTRVLLMESLAKDIKNEYTNIKSERLIDEIKSFVWENDKPQAIRGAHDDLVMAYSMYTHLVEFVYSSRPTPIHSQKKAVNYENMDTSEIDWEEKEERFEEMHGMTLEEWYWFQGKDMPKEYIEWKKKRNEEDIPIEDNKDNKAEEFSGPPIITS